MPEKTTRPRPIGSGRALAGPPLIASAPDTVAIERLVFSVCHWALIPLRRLSGWVSRSLRERGRVE